MKISRLAWGLLLLPLWAGCPTRTVYYDAGGEQDSGPGGRTQGGSRGSSGGHGGVAGAASVTGGNGGAGGSAGVNGMGGVVGAGGASGGGGNGVTGPGGAPQTGGAPGTAGAAALGGGPGTGGHPATGGVAGQGSGGATGGGSGGGTHSGGTSGAGGIGGIAGHQGTGGLPATGGVSGTGGDQCASIGETNCNGTCTDLTSDDTHCGACSGANSDCTLSGQTVKHCRASQCRLADGYSCNTDSDCFSGKCDVFYADIDQDGYPDLRNTGRFCTFPATVGSANGPSTPYIPPRSDAKWDCCDQATAVNPGATQFFSWANVSTIDAECVANRGDTNCDGKVEVDPSVTITTSCMVQSDGSCDRGTRTPTSADCGQNLCGCGAPAPNSSCVLYCGQGTFVNCL